MGITFVNNHSEVCCKCEKDYKNVRHDTAIIHHRHLPSSTLIDCEFPFTHCSTLPWICDGHEVCFLWLLLLPFLKIELAYTTAIHQFIATSQAPRKLVLTGQLHHAINRQLILILGAWSTFDPRYLAHFVILRILCYCYPIKCMRLIIQFYGSRH